jgi:hypothetical protein
LVVGGQPVVSAPQSSVKRSVPRMATFRRVDPQRCRRWPRSPCGTRHCPHRRSLTRTRCPSRTPPATRRAASPWHGPDAAPMAARRSQCGRQPRPGEGSSDAGSRDGQGIRRPGSPVTGAGEHRPGGARCGTAGGGAFQHLYVLAINDSYVLNEGGGKRACRVRWSGFRIGPTRNVGAW